MISPAPGWDGETVLGRASELHAGGPPERAHRTVRVLEVDGPALVLGSSQSVDLIDLAAAADAGLDVTGRRSGGGAVVLVPGEHVWVDFWVPRGDPLWLDDVVRGADWVGAAWAEALQAIGIAQVEVHGGGLVARPWSDLVCFAGLGPGEVSAAGQKFVGVSQRRTRGWIRVQTMVHRRWCPDLWLASFRLTDVDRRRAAQELSEAVGVIGDAPVVESLLASLPDAPGGG